MTLASMLRDYAAFNTWANTQMVQWLQAQPEALMLRETNSSFSTLKDTLLHIWSAEDIWLQRLQLVSPARFLFQEFSGTTQDVFEGLVMGSQAFESYVRLLPDADFNESCAFKLLNGTSDERLRSQMIHHCMNHSTYHRGQIVTMARGFGLTDPPATDFIRYIRLRETP
ncbi:MAG: DinB family protein [Saprospiraceae bacterium]|nr:DinB family protein [Saprospiraceae bacterium]